MTIVLLAADAGRWPNAEIASVRRSAVGKPWDRMNGPPLADMAEPSAKGGLNSLVNGESQ